MPLLRLLLVALYPLAIVILLLKRKREVQEAARRSGGRVEAVVGARSPRSLRAIVFVGIALLFSYVGRIGGALALVFVLITAPLVAASLVRLLAVTTTGLIVDARFTPWEELSGWIVEPSGRLLVLRRAAGEPPITLALQPRELRIASAALALHLPAIQPA